MEQGNYSIRCMLLILLTHKFANCITIYKLSQKELLKPSKNRLEMEDQVIESILQTTS